jgi:acyl-CoA thioester hydrolase
MRRKPAHAHGGGVETTFRVRYAETDGQGIVYSAHYLVWFEIGRTEWCRRAGIDYRRLEEQGYFLVVAEARCRYLSPARYDDEVTVQCCLTSAQRRRLEFRYEVKLPSEGRRLAVGETVHIWVNRDGRPILLPEPLHRLFESGPLASAASAE